MLHSAKHVLTAPPPRSRDRYTQLLLHGNGIDGSTTFPDASLNRHVGTTSGAPVVDDAFSKFGGSSIAFDGASLVIIPAHVGFNFGSGAFTIEFWARSTVTSRQDPLSQNNNFPSANWYGLIYNLGASGDMALFENSNSRISGSSTGWNDGNFHHHAITRSGNSVRLFLDGVQIGSTFTTSFSYGNSTTGIAFGGAFDLGSSFTGNIGEICLSKGIARWTANFRPPQQQYP
jgi:hypothetical protein